MNERLDLARALAAHPRWTWEERMVTTCRLTILDGGDRDFVVGHRLGATRDGGGWYDGPAAGLVPDLADDGTAGVLLGMLGRAMPLRSVLVCREQNGTWNVETWQGDTLGEAGARALLAAWPAVRS